MNRRILALSPPKQLTESPPPPPSTTSDPPPPPKCLYTVQRNNETWTIVHRRGPEFEPPRSAMNSWFLYRDGFGSNETNEYWLGLEAIHDLTKDEPKTLRIEAWSNEDKNQKWIEQVDEFAISDETDNYRLLIGDQSLTKQQGPIVRALVFHNNSQFSTADRDNDEWNGGNCAAVAGGGWWYKHCANILPTGHYYSLWVNDKPLDKVHYFDGVLMMIR